MSGSGLESRSFEVGNQVLISRHRKLLSSKAMVVNVAEKLKRDSGRSPGRAFGSFCWGGFDKWRRDQKHRRLPGPTAGRLDHLKVGDGCVGKAAEPADVVATLRGRRWRCCRGCCRKNGASSFGAGACKRGGARDARLRVRCSGSGRRGTGRGVPSICGGDRPCRRPQGTCRVRDEGTAEAGDASRVQVVC
jgi:hypothetical protein